MLERNSEKHRRMLVWRVPRIANRLAHTFWSRCQPLCQFIPEKRRRLLKRLFPRLGLALFTLLAGFLAACGPAGAEAASPTFTPLTSTAETTKIVNPTPTETGPQQFSIESLTFSNDQTENQKIITELQTQGLESSIKLESDGYHTSFTRWENEQPVTEDILIDPSTLAIDINNKNVYGKTPTIETDDGKTLLWSQEHKNWFAPVEIQKDNIMEPVFVPFGFQDVLLRSLLLNPEISAPFGPNARFEGLRMGFRYDEKTGEKYVYLFSLAALSSPDVTKDQLGVAWTNTWFYTTLEDGTKYQYTPTKWLDPQDPNNPRMDEFKIIFCAVGSEVIGPPAPVDLRDVMIPNLTNNNEAVPNPILASSENIFEDAVLFPGVAGKIFFQPSLSNLFKQAGNDPRLLDFLNSTIDPLLTDLGQTNTAFDLPFSGVDYSFQLDPQIQTMIIPCQFGTWMGTTEIQQ